MFKGPWRAIDAIPYKPPQGDTGSLWRTGPPFFENTFKKKDLCFTALDSLSFASKSVDSRESRGFGIMGISAGEKMISQSTFWSSLVLLRIEEICLSKNLFDPFATWLMSMPNFFKGENTSTTVSKLFQRHGSFNVECYGFLPLNSGTPKWTVPKSIAFPHLQCITRLYIAQN